jgi:hypothetical protein
VCKLPIVQESSGNHPQENSFDLNKLLQHVSDSYNPEVGLWSTVISSTVSSWGSGCSNQVEGSNLFFFSSENVITPVAIYELGNPQRATQAIQKMLSHNPFVMSYREEVLYGQLIPVLKQAGNAGCQVLESGQLSNGKSYAVENNFALADPNAGVPTNGLGPNGALAYQIIGDFIRGGTNYLTWLNTISREFDGTGFPSSKVNGAYQTRAFAAAGCALLICGDPLGIFPAMNQIAAKLQASDGTFPNSYVAAVQGASGDGESYNRFLLWRCPRWLSYMKSLKGTKTQSDPYDTQYSPPEYLLS